MSRPVLTALRAAVAVAAVAAFTPHIAGQTESGSSADHSFPVRGFGAGLRTELIRVEEMLSSGDMDIVSAQDDTMIGGRIHERLGQMYRGLPVFHAQVVRQMDGRSIVSVAGRLYDNIEVDTTPQLSAGEAADAVIKNSGSGAAVRKAPVLGVLPLNGRFQLAYRMEIASDWDIRDVAIDAHTGALLYSRSTIEHVNTIGKGTGVIGDTQKMSVNSTSSTYQAIDGLRPAPTFTLTFPGTASRLNQFLATGLLFNSDIATDSDNVWTDPAVVDAHVYQGFVYDYYFKRQGRHGIDDHNLEIDGIVHPLDRSQISRQSPDVIDTFINNAFFCCDGIMFYGDGDGRNFTYMAGGLDVVGHEMSHGVTQFSSNLDYQDEPGALNEAFSDMMGAAIEFFFQPQGSGPGKSDWLIGEDVTLSPPGYIRNLNNPNAVGDPDHYSLRRFIGTDTDNGGVHFNMTIATHAYYLAIAGGKNRVSNQTVAGVGMNNMDRIEKIFYRGFVFLMTPNSNFSDAKAATLQAATDLYGANSNERAQVLAAWNAVGVN